MSFALDTLILATGWIHVLLAPYTKVEESFNLHAVHDVLMYGVHPSSLSHYDHFVFPGAVPRTFIGSLLLAWVSQPAIYVANYLHLVHTKFELQIILRLVLATVNAFGLCLIRHAVSQRFGRLTGLYYALLTCSQFHVPFWMGRTLPNMLALFPVNLSLYLLIPRAPNALKPTPRSASIALSLAVFSAVVFRAELAALAAALALQSVVLRYISLRRVVLVGATASLLSILLTLCVDSYFWRQPYLWPEWHSIRFNVLQGKSADWGTSPWHAYLTSALPKLLLAALPLSLLFAPLSSSPRRLLPLVVPGAALVAAMSAVGHKEWRFVVYVVPACNVLGARGLAFMSTLRKSTLLGRLLFLGACGALLANLGATALLTRAAVRNYPGGEAMGVLNAQYAAANANAKTHLCNLALQSGASLFTHVHAPPYYYLPSAGAHNATEGGQGWVYDKTDAPASWEGYTFLVSETPSPAPPTSSSAWFSSKEEKGWNEIGRVSAFERWAVNRGWRGEGRWNDKAMGVLRLEERERLYVMERAGK